MPEVTSSLQNLLMSKDWVGFDLDDTLHEFRIASNAASSGIFDRVHRDYGVPLEDLRLSYRQILTDMTAGAFADGKLSSDYRRERFAALLHSQDIVAPSGYLECLLAVYKRTLASSLCLKAGALDLLERLKTLEKKIIIITEGPWDAQDWTIEQLGLKDYVDVLVTSNELKTSKTDGLFGQVLRKYDIPASQMIYIGDNELRDILPAEAEGIMAIHVSENSRVCVDPEQGSIKIDALTRLMCLFNDC
ncbi:HAD-like protein [Aspergillus steynii IBT 23096]|uniref:HAD-like protein n=1 Tax=Aspergillus steynii IBT 23096 TaxID=1392250 RepID=A0A2I2G0J0_9EURO|nr:HAD-like protein [Aspergillus steynii IBT 23096]PLB46356.1 HAD-like protein [Aspergillus steynii IBT 23096]